eukprot:Plantae.Rhodophyta-Hildenbrandia_rubra.ctg8950.p1 GENE.Plantae.Rhodophyta-Hildenbrandia_rubra.ctg8950~~Plantae.Rhodophyta-Hildenbrandia_rubra.ctg8950.p1  ORF type:complete len:683 (+),score=101.79 Plantae.Rhodophyta-Hildenbrandia_rubra.ctg8950:301-2349(+)
MLLKDENCLAGRRPLSTRENEDFVRDYFAQSRLHFLGFFRARYEGLLATVASRLGVEIATLLHGGVPPAEKKRPRESIICHIDMDCFFASVARVKNPSLATKPIVVCHSSNNVDFQSGGEVRGGEISAASYEARAFGVRAGMLFGHAQRLCPELVAVPYDFELYEEVSIRIYTLFHKIPGVLVEAVSVDEVYLDLTYSIQEKSEVDGIIDSLRNQIYSETGCTASAGVGSNKLVARLATKRAKPNGQLLVWAEEAFAFISTMKLEDITGIGWKTLRRLEQLKIKTLSQLQAVDIPLLQKEFGDTQGKIFYDAVRGRDHRKVEPLKPRKSIGVDCSWGVRFEKDEDEKVEKFIADMADEVVSRLRSAGANGRRVTYKVMRRKKDAGMAHKFLGHGPCDVYNRIAEFSSLAGLKVVCLQLHKEIKCPNNEFRGVGIKVSDVTFHSLALNKPGAKSRSIERYFRPSMVSSCDAEEVLPTTSKEEQSARLKNGFKGKMAERYPEADQESAKKIDHQLEVGDKIEEHLNNDRASVKPEGRGQITSNHDVYSLCDNERDLKKADESGIQKGWDKEVFHALPQNVREELVGKKSSHTMRQKRGLSLSAGVTKTSRHMAPKTTLMKMLQTSSKKESARNVKHTQKKNGAIIAELDLHDNQASDKSKGNASRGSCHVDDIPDPPVLDYDSG